jgi:ABC-type Mn2+/Zn2+ transport system permease subunit
MNLGSVTTARRGCASLFLALGHVRGWAGFSGSVPHALAAGVLPAMFLLRSSRDEIYNILWALVFGFATLNILSLGARRFEEQKTGMNFGEILAILVVLVSVVLLGWELLYLFHILPIRLTRS